VIKRLKKLLGLSLTKLQLFAARVRCRQYALSAYASSRAPPIRINLNLPFRVLNEAGTRWSVATHFKPSALLINNNFLQPSCGIKQ